jgi:biotin-(acetyl-CoA carboxylase) ligase
VRVEQGDAVLEGVAQGTDADGSLQVLIDGCVHRFHSGDVSLRAADP